MGVIERAGIVSLGGVGYLYKLVNHPLSSKETVLEFL